ncbi:MAG: argininosuccinate lyase [Thermoplasmata archaeon]|nr:argininosuccinate lyase [Thermoplasmata archaeon]
MLRDKFSRPLDPAAARLSASTREDATLLPYDVWGSLAHARMLTARRIIPRRDGATLQRGLRAIARQVERGRFRLDPSLEDVHLNVEAALSSRIGRAGGRLHAGRSRNDQVAVDLALYLRDALLDLEFGGTGVVEALLGRARSGDGRGVVPGSTHFQPAQRLYWGQILATHALRFARDVERFRSIRERLTDSPLGSGALAGSSLPLDRALTARLLGFERAGPSSLDGVTDRDAAVETLGALALFHVHSSALAEELVVAAMPELDRVRLDDAFVTTSSLMPHKRNPDLAELARASAAPAIGRLVAHLTLLKALPIGYQRDLQQGKPLLFDGVADAIGVMRVLAPMIATARYRSSPARASADTASVELADALVLEGVPFRTAHTRVSRFIARLATSDRHLSDVAAAELWTAFPELNGGRFRLPTAAEEPERRATAGGSSWREVRRLVSEVGRRARTSSALARRESQRIERLKGALGAPRVRPA